MHPYRLIRGGAGKILAGLAGWLVFGLPGAAAGVVIGAVIDLWAALTVVVGLVWHRCGMDRWQRIFVGAAALVMGAVAKADGRVSEAEVAAARRVLLELQLDDRGRSRAIRIFHRGKVPGAPLRATLWLLRWGLKRRPEAAARFLDFQLRVAAADGSLNADKERMLRWIWRRLGISQDDLTTRLRSVRRGDVAKNLRPTLDHAYRLLGVSPTAGADEVRRAYRRAISRVHPDRLVSRGASESEIEAAGERTFQVRAAYEAIRDAREIYQ